MDEVKRYKQEYYDTVLRAGQGLVEVTKEIELVSLDDYQALQEKFQKAKAALEECRKASKVNEPMIDKMIIRNITGVALGEIEAIK